MQKLGLVLGVGCVVFIGIFAFVVASRIDQVTIALLLGTLVGLAVGMPMASALTFLLVRDSSRAGRQPAPPMPPAPAPMTTPTANLYPLGATASPPIAPSPSLYLPPADLSQPLAPALPRPRRSFYVVGDDGHVSEVQ